MNRYIAEVIAAHVAIEHWLNQGEGSAEALLHRFSPEFSMIPINGMRMDHQSVSVFFREARASRPGLKIVIDNAAILAEWHDGAAVLYREIHALPGKADTARWSTVLFRLQEGKIIWLHLHETALA